MDFLWHKVSEKEKQEIQAQAKKLLDNFSNKLSRIGTPLEDVSIERGSGERDESNGENKRAFSKEIMFNNAKEKRGDFVIAEKKTW